MNNLLTILRGGVAIANSVTRPLQAIVQYEKYLSDDGYGSAVYAPAIPLHAIVEYKAVQVRTISGVLTVSRAVIELLDIAEVIAATGGQGVGNNDRFILPDGDTGPTLDIGGFVDAGTGHPIATSVRLG